MRAAPDAARGKRKNRMKLQDKVAIVTGGAQGIGEGIVRQFIAEGSRVMIADIQDEKAQVLCDELGADRCQAARYDVSNSADVKALIAATLTAFGRIDIGVCNSGINHNENKDLHFRKRRLF